VIKVLVENDEQGELRLRLEKLYFGNYSVSYLDKDFLHGGDYKQIRQTADALEGLMSPTAFVSRGEQKRGVSSFKQAIEWLLEEAKRGLSIQRYKGLGEMNPEQLWETTMFVKNRILLKVRIEDTIAADEVFTTLMGDLVEPRRAFIEKNALGAKNLDV
jgi:DNA gyrase subunit B